MKKPKDKFEGLTVVGERFTQFVPAEILENKDWVANHLMPIVNRLDADITVEEVNAAVKAAQK